MQHNRLPLTRYLCGLLLLISYPQDNEGNFTPGYFYVSADQTVKFTLMAQDGATLHIFDDAAGTNEIALPSTLAHSGQAQTSSDGSILQMGDVFLTQGWHKLYVEHSLLSLRSGEDAEGTFCSLSYSSGILYNEMQSVSADYAFNEWEEDADGNFSSTGVVTFTLPGGEPAIGDGVTTSISGMLTEDTEQQYTDYPEEPVQGRSAQVSVTPATITSSSTTDNEGKVYVTLHWSGSAPTNPTDVYFQFSDTSRVSAATGGPAILKPPPMPAPKPKLSHPESAFGPPCTNKIGILGNYSK